MAVQQLSMGGSDGVNLGQSTTDKIGIYGLTAPIVQPGTTITAATLAGVNGTTAVIATGATAYGYSTVTQANAIITAINALTTDVNDIQSALRALNLLGSG